VRSATVDVYKTLPSGTSFVRGLSHTKWSVQSSWSSPINNRKFVQMFNIYTHSPPIERRRRDETPALNWLVA
jgi:hypothetical protein